MECLPESLNLQRPMPVCRRRLAAGLRRALNFLWAVSEIELQFAIKAVEENSDYKMVAHISIEGNVIWCIAPGDAPAKDVIKIRHVADMERNRYEVWLSTLSEMERYA